MPQEIARQWFVPGDGIDRHVISADIQRYLGNDATVRPGLGTGENQGVQGYWIKAYRNLTSAMIADLRADSARWRQEQRQTGTREPYVGSSTYHASSASRTSHNRRDGDSPSVDGPYGLPASREARIPVERMQDRMQIDPPPQVSRGGFQPDSRAPYPPDGRAFPSDGRGYAPDGRSSFPSDAPMSSGGFNGRPPVSAPYGGQEPRYAPSYPQSNDGAPPGYVRQGNYYVPVSSFEQTPSVPSRADNYGPGSFGQPPQGREPRDARYQQPEYADPRYAYPSPAATVSSVSARDREPISSPAQPSYGAVPPSQYDQYGGRTAPSSGSTGGSSASNPSRQSVFGRVGGSSGRSGRR
ncbi:hypothetical protein M409DRAFT_63403 [Zasmidium cellare ATCC 36951]|uniref:Uncharacterized protein n=1 Tax=Zasmidium cellare ATCC 36951 TaxID=1080233 RepID=A0A6A6CX94_ZASCE|nr:uncharacterized protein M409DRAFT_63403 [Zasmidium cellare ATCC 36951]KAF2171847.1 hypothetical protein M409DRAFT_63403 [Zasmidium cellare ATCC 36951]